jgi:hypothetical protein
MKLTIPSGWTAKEANQTVYEGQTPKVQPNSSAVNITKGNYILYINTQAQQASGAEGGRFAEIAMGAPSADAVVTQQPSPPCGTSESQSADNVYTRVDLFVAKSDIAKTSYCKAPASGTNVWYFSYITNSKKGYFNYYTDDTPPGLVVTMAYNSKDVNKLPQKGSAEVNQALTEMTDIFKTLEIKKK